MLMAINIIDVCKSEFVSLFRSAEAFHFEQFFGMPRFPTAANCNLLPPWLVKDFATISLKLLKHVTNSPHLFNPTEIGVLLESINFIKVLMKWKTFFLMRVSTFGAKANKYIQG